MLTQNRQTAWPPNRIYALLMGIVFVVLAVFGWIFAPSGSLLFGVFATAITRNIIFSVTGVLGLLAAFLGNDASRLFNRVFGIVYLLWGILSFIPGFNTGGVLFGFIHYNWVDNVMEIILGIMGIYMGFYVAPYIDRAERSHT